MSHTRLALVLCALLVPLAGCSTKTRKMYKIPDMKHDVPLVWLVALGLLVLAIGIQGCGEGEDDEECEEGLLICARDIEPVTVGPLGPSCPGVNCPLTSPNPPLFPTTPPPPFETNPPPPPALLPPPSPTLPRPPSPLR